MARKRSPARFLLDTSAVVHQLHGPTLQQSALREAVAHGVVQVPVFIRMEYLRAVMRKRLQRRQIDLAGKEVRQRFESNPGFVRQSEQAEVAANTTARTPSCRWCERLGDTIIALQAGRGTTVVTADRTFVALGELLNQPVVLLPSLAELKRRGDTP